MSRYAWLVCEDTKEFIWLGKICQEPMTGQTFFHIGEPEQPRNSENPKLTKAILKFLASNMGRTIRVWPEELFDAKIEDGFVGIGSDDENSIAIESYIAGFQG